MATLTDDVEMVYRNTNDGFAENAVYLATCMINQLLKRIKDCITCQILPSLHALTGYDTTSAFFRNGKKSVYKILKTSLEELSDLVSLTNIDAILETTINAVRHAVSLLYDPKREKLKSCHHDLKEYMSKHPHFLQKRPHFFFTKTPPLFFLLKMKISARFRTNEATCWLSYEAPEGGNQLSLYLKSLGNRTPSISKLHHISKNPS